MTPAKKAALIKQMERNRIEDEARLRSQKTQAEVAQQKEDWKAVVAVAQKNAQKPLRLDCKSPAV